MDHKPKTESATMQTNSEDNNLPVRLHRWRLWESRYFTLVVVLILALFVSTLSSQYFWTTDNLQAAVSNFFVELAFVTIGQTLVILVRGIDLSVGGTAAMASVTIGFAYAHGLNIWCALALGLLMGGACGLVNGCLVTLFRTPPMIATLGSGLLYLGIVNGVTHGRPYSDFPNSFQTLGQGQIGVVPVQLVLLVIVGILIHILLSRTRFGRYVYAIGGNPVAAEFSGIRVGRMVTAMYTLSGLLAACAGAVMAARLLAAGPLLAKGMELGSITAVLLGGVSITGGEGTVSQALLGMLIIAILRSAMTLVGVTHTVQLTAIAVLLLVVVVLEKILARKRAES